MSRSIPAKEPLVEGLVHRRDLIALGARRRNGKTSFVTDLAVSVAVGEPDFLGYGIPDARRVLMLMLEDDTGEYQEKLRRVVGVRDTGERLRVVMRDDFYDIDVPINVAETRFQEAIEAVADEHRPDLIVMDNLSQLVCADYNDAKKIDVLIRFCYGLARSHNAAVIIPAHPRKEDQEHPVDLVTKPTSFFESIMGSSHFINSTGSLWGLQRRDLNDNSVAFLGGRQRGD
jgi:RecA-family ATPase